MIPTFDQRAFFQHIAQKLEDPNQLTSQVMETLDLGYQVVRRRIQGQIKINIEEFLKLVERYPSASQFIFKEVFQRKRTLAKLEDFTNEEEFLKYLKNTHAIFQKVLTANRPKMKIITRDLPFYLFFRSKELLEYKFSQWTHILDRGGVQSLSPEVILWARKVYDTYLEIPSYEIWDPFAIDGEMLQCDRCLEDDILTFKEGARIMEHLESLKEDIRQWRLHETKPTGSAFFLSFSRNINTSNTFLLKNDEHALLVNTWFDSKYFKSDISPLFNEFTKTFNRLVKE